MTYPAYTRAERIADGVVHIAGLIAAIVGVTLLFALWAAHFDGPTLVSTIVYACALVGMLSASAVYHMAAHTSLRPLLRRLDHAAIYFKIAGTYTPLGVALGTTFGYAVLACAWLLAVVGAARKLLTAPGKMTTGWLPYVLLGWGGLLLFVPLAPLLPLPSLILIVAGGALYTLGVVFYAWESLRFANAIWHGFIVAASSCFFLGITGVLTTA